MRITFFSAVLAGVLSVVSPPMASAGQSTAAGAVKPFIVNEWAQSGPGKPRPAPFVQATQKLNNTPIPPKKPWGDPDLEGNWAKRSGIPTNIAWQTQPLPFTPEGLKAYNNVVNEIDPTSLCIMPGVPRVMNSAGFPMEIFQTPKAVVMMYEYMHNYRIIWLDRRHPKDILPSNLGHSVGRWEGDTLVVDTVGLSGQTWLDDHGNRHSDALHMIEKYRRVSADQISYEGTYDDPKFYTKPWTTSWLMVLNAPGTEILEYACTDYNHSLEIGGQRPGPIDGSGRNGTAIAVPPPATPANPTPTPTAAPR